MSRSDDRTCGWPAATLPAPLRAAARLAAALTLVAPTFSCEADLGRVRGGTLDVYVYVDAQEDRPNATVHVEAVWESFGDTHLTMEHVRPGLPISFSPESQTGPIDRDPEEFDFDPSGELRPGKWRITTTISGNPDGPIVCDHDVLTGETVVEVIEETRQCFGPAFVVVEVTHDVAASGVTPRAPEPLLQNRRVYVDAEVANHGDEPETFDVEVLGVTGIQDGAGEASLGPHSSTTVAFEWTVPDHGTFEMRARASTVTAESDVANNTSPPRSVTVLPNLDGDEYVDADDNCPQLGHPDRSDCDGDGVGDPCDNCPCVENPGQEDDDGDTIGNACDLQIHGFAPRCSSQTACDVVTDVGEHCAVPTDLDVTKYGGCVIVFGEGFEQGAQVRLGTQVVPPSDVVVCGTNRIDFRVPSATCSPAPISVTTSEGTVSASQQHCPPGCPTPATSCPGGPRVDSFYPRSQNVQERVFVLGCGFGASTPSVKVGSEPADYVEVFTDTLLWFRVPPSATDGKITVTIGGQDLTTAAILRVHP